MSWWTQFYYLLVIFEQILLLDQFSIKRFLLFSHPFKFLLCFQNFYFKVVNTWLHLLWAAFTLFKISLFRFVKNASEIFVSSNCILFNHNLFSFFRVNSLWKSVRRWFKQISFLSLKTLWKSASVWFNLAKRLNRWLNTRLVKRRT